MFDLIYNYSLNNSNRVFICCFLCHYCTNKRQSFFVGVGVSVSDTVIFKHCFFLGDKYYPQRLLRIKREVYHS